MMGRAALVVWSVAAVGCGARVALPAAPPDDDRVLASLRRTECLERCPTYGVTIYRDGAVEYVGESHVSAVGRRLARITAAQVVELEELFVSSGFLQMRAAYPQNDCTDQPGAHLWYRPRGGPMKVVEHDYGDRSAPEALFHIAARIDVIVEIERWTGRRDGPLLGGC